MNNPEDRLSLIANVSQLIDLGLNIGQTSNDQIMMALERQNKIYLETILDKIESLSNEIKELRQS